MNLPRQVTSLVLANVALTASILLSTGCSPAAKESPLAPRHLTADNDPFAPSSSDTNPIRFDEVTDESGIDFVHFDPATPEHLIHETMGSGLAWIDYDADGWPDLFCVQSCPLPKADGSVVEQIDESPRPRRTHRLFRNLGQGRFADVTAVTGLDRTEFGMGVAVGDFDNDGYDDLAVTRLGGVSLWHNVPDQRTDSPATTGGRRFVDISETAGFTGTNSHWATSCAWGDLDGDTRLDLYVCHYVETDPNRPLICRDPVKDLTHACPPTAYPATAHRLYRNLGGGRFQDVSASSGITLAHPAPGLGVAIVDLDLDGRQDIYVANDLYPAFLFHNQTDPGQALKLEERAGLAGSALGPNGVSMSGMCVEVGETHGSGYPSLFVTNYQGQPNVLFRNDGNLFFHEVSALSGLAAPSRDRLGFGAALFDADNDGALDLAVANGHVYRDASALLNVPYAQLPQLFRGNGKGRFREVSASAGDYFRTAHVGRSIARADFDRDGRIDVAVSHVGGKLALLRNVTTSTNRWIAFDLVGNPLKVNRNALGASVLIETPKLQLTRFLAGGGSYLAAHEKRLVVGVGSADNVRVTIRWPNGENQVLDSLRTQSRWRIEQDQGRPVAIEL